MQYDYATKLPLAIGAAGVPNRDAVASLGSRRRADGGGGYGMGYLCREPGGTGGRWRLYDKYG